MAHIEVLFDNLPLQLVGQLVMHLIMVEEVDGLPWAEDDRRLPVDGFIVHLGRLRGRVLLNFATLGESRTHTVYKERTAIIILGSCRGA